MSGEEMTIPKLFRSNRGRGHVAALVTEEGSITHAELDDRSRTLAACLVGDGVGKGARVGLLAPNGIEWAVWAAAVTRVGGVLVPLSTLLRPPELAALLQVAGVTHLAVQPTFRGRSYLDDLETVAPDVVARTGDGRRHPSLPFLRRVWDLNEPPATGVAFNLVAALEEAVRPADDLAVLFTSGSRGTPKGVVHTHGGGLRAVAAGLEARCIGPDDRVYIPMPFFWTGGFSSGLLSTLVAGATLLTEMAPEPEQTLALLERERATLFRGWPDQAARLAAHPGIASFDLSSLGPGSLPALLPAQRRPAPGARANLFGMTEAFGPYCGARLDQDLPEAARGSCGRPFDGVEVRIGDPSTEAACAPGEVGEIRLRGRNMMRGICGRTRDATFDADGYYATGDLGHVDSEGFLFYNGRLDDMFKVKGATVYPSEVEAALRGIPGVREAHVTNVPEPDGSQAVGALVVTALASGDLRASTRAALSAFKVPTLWVVTPSNEAVPTTATGKVDRNALQVLLREEGITP
jgi:acyl-CoA synthetase (AMP-forming)/AMP-acid ligase II